MGARGLTGARGPTGTRGLIERADETSLIAAARSGDRAAFDELVRRTYRDTYQLALRLVGDPDDARDITQEVYLRAFRGLDGFRGDARFSTWLYRITANRASTHLRRRIRHRHVELPDELCAPDEVDGPQHAVDLRTDLTRALAKLPVKLRSVVVLRDIYGLSHVEIARELSISESAAKVRLHRARQRLRGDLFPAGSSGHGARTTPDSPGAIRAI